MVRTITSRNESNYKVLASPLHEFKIFNLILHYCVINYDPCVASRKFDFKNP